MCEMAGRAQGEERSAGLWFLKLKGSEGLRKFGGYTPLMVSLARRSEWMTPKPNRKVTRRATESVSK